VKLRERLFAGAVLFAFAVTLAMLQVRAARAPGIESPSCERIATGLYRIDFQTSPHTGPVEVFASSRPDRIDSARAVLTIQRPPAEVSVPDDSHRVYFHLKPVSGATRVVSIRRLPLEGATNFRDLGGYRTYDGRYVRWGLVYRSNHLVDLTARDYEYLKGLGIRLVCDVRTESERLRSPTQWKGRAPEFQLLPIGPERDAKVTMEELRQRLSRETAGQHSTRGYDRLAIDYALQFGTILRRLAAGDLPAVEHCSGGKDRTGLFSAILLTALGVPRDVVIQDYLLTNKYMLAPDSIERTALDLQRILGLPERPDDSLVTQMMTARAETLEAAFDSITKTYGGFDNYMRSALKISNVELAQLRRRLLEP
jgi:protein-tyrosine phosphatase